STKVLLQDFQPVEILFFRFLIGLIVLKIAWPHILKTKNWKEEITFAAAGLSGICLYYLLENISLTYTMASNVGVICSVAPFFTAILSRIFMKEEGRLTGRFMAGFVLAMAGICLISFNGTRLQINPLGDMLALLAVFVWACYSLLTKRIAGFGYPTLAVTGKTFVYGLLFMIPALVFFDFQPGFERFAEPKYLLNILFLGLGASAACFVTWNFAVKVLGAVKTSVYIYMIPVVTVVFSALILHEPVTALSAAGIILTLAGLFLSESRGKEKHRENAPD
ncbi:MAG: DMT family transporter, partial [Emergencia sp.]